MNWQFLISTRYLFEKRRERFISVTSFISVLGIAIGVATLIVTMGIMNGFNDEIEQKILSVNPHLVVGKDGVMADPKELVSRLASTGGVSSVCEFMDGQAIISARDKVMGVLARGIDEDPARQIMKVDKYLVAGSSSVGAKSALIGSELARNFSLRVQDSFSIFSPVTGQREEFKVSGIFKSGRYDYDLTLVFIGITEAKKILGGEGIVNGMGIKVNDVFDVDSVKKKIAAFVRPPFWIMTWKDIDKNLFAALKLEKIVMFILVTLIICVACFSVISTLIMTVMEKTKDVGVLKAIGVTRAGVMSVFLLEGLYISVTGILVGAGLGLGLCYLQSEYKLVKLPPDVYYIYSVPVSVRAPDTLIILASAFVLGLIATVYPSVHAGSLDPVEALRCE